MTGDAYVDAVGLTEMIHELLSSILTAALVIFGLIAILFRSVRIGLITIPPNVIPLVVTFGYMGLADFDLNAGNVIVFTISLGIAVDNTIHYILRFREEFAKDPHMERATWKTMLGKGQPMCHGDVFDGDRPGRAAPVRLRPHASVCRTDHRDSDRGLDRSLVPVAGVRRHPLETAHRPTAAAGSGTRQPPPDACQVDSRRFWPAECCHRHKLLSISNFACNVHLRHGDCISVRPETLSTFLAAERSRWMVSADCQVGFNGPGESTFRGPY